MPVAGLQWTAVGYLCNCTANLHFVLEPPKIYHLNLP
jgi:hypothetical protein